MRKDIKVLPITDDVKWIGVLDYDIKVFDIVMETKYGATYNSYFINAQKKTIIETTKEKFWDVYKAKIEQVCNPAEIECIILNHTEPDHSGNLQNLLAIAPNATVYGSGQAIRYIKDQFAMDFKYEIVKDGDTIDLGNKTLKVIGAPNLHWPDTIYTYLEEDKVLFTCDSFGSHFCNEEMYDDKVGDFDEAFKYYFDVILKPFSKFLLKAIEKIRPLEIKAICNGHGPILTTQWKRLVDLSEEYAKEYLKHPEHERVYIPYVSAYNKTGKLAQWIAEGVKEAGDIEVVVQDIENVTAGEIDMNITLSSGIIIGSPTINQNILPQIYNLFAFVNPLRDKNKLAGGFGSYGWSGEAAKMIKSNAENLKLNYFNDGMFIKFSPHDHKAEEYKAYGRAFAQKLLSK